MVTLTVPPEPRWYHENSTDPRPFPNHNDNKGWADPECQAFLKVFNAHRHIISNWQFMNDIEKSRALQEYAKQTSEWEAFKRGENAKEDRPLASDLQEDEDGMREDRRGLA